MKSMTLWKKILDIIFRYLIISLFVQPSSFAGIIERFICSFKFIKPEAQVEYLFNYANRQYNRNANGKVDWTDVILFYKNLVNDHGAKLAFTPELFTNLVELRLDPIIWSSLLNARNFSEDELFIVYQNLYEKYKLNSIEQTDANFNSNFFDYFRLMGNESNGGKLPANIFNDLKIKVTAELYGTPTTNSPVNYLISGLATNDLFFLKKENSRPIEQKFTSFFLLEQTSAPYLIQNFFPIPNNDFLYMTFTSSQRAELSELLRPLFVENAGNFLNRQNARLIIPFFILTNPNGASEINNFTARLSIFKTYLDANAWIWGNDSLSDLIKLIIRFYE